MCDFSLHLFLFFVIFFVEEIHGQCSPTHHPQQQIPSFCSDKYSTIHQLSLETPLDLLENTTSLLKDQKIIGIFQFLEHSARKVYYNDRHIPCYQWKCFHHQFIGQHCEYCLPHVVIAGFGKCGTTTLAQVINFHPNMTLYSRKELDIFLPNSIAGINHFEERTKANEVYNMSLDFKSSVVWVDGTNQLSILYPNIAFLTHLSPQSKIIMMVRDPFQGLASYYSMLCKFSLRNVTDKNSPEAQRIVEDRILLHFKRKSLHYQRYVNMPIVDRYNTTNLRLENLHKVPFYQFLLGEMIFPWYMKYGKNLLVIDNAQLKCFPERVVHAIEEFLNLPHYNFSPEQLYLRSNPFGAWYSAEQVSSNSKPLGSSYVHKSSKPVPEYKYSPRWKELLRPLYRPSLCFFHRLFGWSIHLEPTSL